MMSANGLKTTLRHRVLLAAAIVAMGLGAEAKAFADPVDLQVVDRQTGKPLQIWRRDGRLFVAGQPGANYSLRVTNHTDGRVLVVMSVDGINILSGETAGYDQRGYIFAPHETDDIVGWRKSLSEVAAFTFAPLPQSYAARTGRPAEVGVIGIAVFNERAPMPVAIPEPLALRKPPSPYPPPPPAPPPPNGMPVPAPGLARAAPSGDPNTQVGEVIVTAQKRAVQPANRADKLGTAHGAIETSVITEEPFERATDAPQFTRQIEYDTYDSLVAAGVIPHGPKHGQAPRPRPFPSNQDNERFVPDPPDGDGAP